MADETVVEPGEIVFTHTQKDIDSAVKARLARSENAHVGILGEKDASIATLNATIETLKAAAEKGVVTKMSASEHTEALEKRLDQMEKDAVDRDKLLADQAAQKVIAGINSDDKDLLMKAGIDPKFADIALNELHKGRTLENGTAFYKDKEGALLDQNAVIESVKAQYPEFITVPRNLGNQVPMNGVKVAEVDYSKETTEQHITRRNAERASAAN